MKTSALMLGAGLALLIYGCSSSNDQSSSNTSGTTASSGTASNATTTSGAASAATTGTAETTAGAATGGAAASASGYAAVQAIFMKSCMPCHSAQRPKGGVDLTSYDAVMKGGRDGATVKAGDPNASDLVAYIKGTKKPQMPKGAPPLSDADQKTISDWIQAGAKNN